MKNIDTLAATVEEGLAAIPLLDAHTHLDAAHLSARGLHDVLLYHMAISDLVSAGCPSRARLSEEPDEAEAQARLSEALPYVRHIRNTSTYWGARIILRDLYGWSEPVTADNWPKLHAIIRERASDPAWPREILKRAGVRRASTELWRGRGGAADDVFQYSLEWAFFTRAQWGVNDIPLYELERAWEQEAPGAPLPVTMGEGRPAVRRPIRTVEDAREAIADYVARIPYGKVLSTAQHISTDITFRPVNDAEMAAALRNREQAATADRDAYASFLFEIFLSSEHANQAMCTLARELPNLSLAGYWWHNFFPGTMRQVMSQRLDMVAANKQVGFFSDAYCADWTYAKALIVRQQLAEVLAQKIRQGQYTLDEALGIARQILFETPQSLLGMMPG